MTTKDQFQTKLSKGLVNFDRFDAIVNGGPTTDVTIDSGTVPSISKALAALGSSGVLPAGGAAGQILRKQSGTDFHVAWEDDIATIPFVIDGGGATITTGVKGDLELDYDGEIIGWTILGDQTGSITIRLMRDTYANYPPTVADVITGSAPITVTSAIKSKNDIVSNLTGWSRTFAANDTLRIEVTAVSGFQRVTLKLKVKKL